MLSEQASRLYPCNQQTMYLVSSARSQPLFLSPDRIPSPRSTPENHTPLSPFFYKKKIGDAGDGTHAPHAN